MSNLTIREAIDALDTALSRARVMANRRQPKEVVRAMEGCARALRVLLWTADDDLNYLSRPAEGRQAEADEAIKAAAE